MRAVRIDEVGGPDVLGVVEMETPEPSEGEVRVRVDAAGVNFIDTYHRTGAYDVDLPAVLGVEAAGTVDAVGAGVTTVRAGDRVAWHGQRGAYAEYQVVPADDVIALPEEVATDVAAAALLQGLTAHYLTHDTFPLSRGDTALVHAAAGGVGHLLTQVAVGIGARVIATCGNEEKAEFVRGLGADRVVVYTREDFTAAVADATDGRGVDVVYDGVGRATFRDGLGCLRPRGMMVLYGQASGAVEPLDPQELNRRGSLFLTRPSLFHYTADAGERRRRADDLFGWLRDGDVEVRIDRRFPLEEAAEAHRYLEGRNTNGKVLITP